MAPVTSSQGHAKGADEDQEEDEDEEAEKADNEAEILALMLHEGEG